jgi:hypothetical protein
LAATPTALVPIMPASANELNCGVPRAWGHPGCAS